MKHVTMKGLGSRDMSPTQKPLCLKLFCQSNKDLLKCKIIRRKRHPRDEIFFFNLSFLVCYMRKKVRLRSLIKHFKLKLDIRTMFKCMLTFI